MRPVALYLLGVFGSRNGWWVAAGPCLLFIYYLVAWWRLGPEPTSGAAVVQYEPPEGLSAAALRYVAYGRTDGRSLAAVIAALAVRGCIRVEATNGIYKLSRLMCGRDAIAALAPEEKRVLQSLFADGSVIELKPFLEQSNVAQHGRFIFDIHDELKKRLGARYFMRHSGIIGIGILATFAMAVPLAIIEGGRDVMTAAFLTGWSLFCGFILGLIFEMSLLPALNNSIKTGVGGRNLIPAVSVIGMFMAAIGFVNIKLNQISPPLGWTLVAFFLVNLGWVPFLKRKTPLGVEVSGRIAGFRNFLAAVDGNALDHIDPQGELQAKAHSLLPYAVALEVKEAWGDHLAQTFCSSTVMVEE